MILCTFTLLLFWLLPNQSPLTSATLLCMSGFFIYGPQSLIGAAAANMATKRAAAAAVGLTGFFGYLSTDIVRCWNRRAGGTQWMGRRVSGVLRLRFDRHAAVCGLLERQGARVSGTERRRD